MQTLPFSARAVDQMFMDPNLPNVANPSQGIPYVNNLLQPYLGQLEGALRLCLQDKANHNPLRIFLFNQMASNHYSNPAYHALLGDVSDLAGIEIGTGKQPMTAIQIAVETMCECYCGVNVEQYPALYSFVQPQLKSAVQTAVKKYRTLKENMMNNQGYVQHAQMPQQGHSQPHMQPMQHGGMQPNMQPNMVYGNHPNAGAQMQPINHQPMYPQQGGYPPQNQMGYQQAPMGQPMGMGMGMPQGGLPNQHQSMNQGVHMPQPQMTTPTAQANRALSQMIPVQTEPEGEFLSAAPIAQSHNEPMSFDNTLHVDPFSENVPGNEHVVVEPAGAPNDPDVPGGIAYNPKTHVVVKETLPNGVITQKAIPKEISDVEYDVHSTMPFEHDYGDAKVVWDTHQEDVNDTIVEEAATRKISIANGTIAATNVDEAIFKMRIVLGAHLETYEENGVCFAANLYSPWAVLPKTQVEKDVIESLYDLSRIDGIEAFIRMLKNTEDIPYELHKTLEERLFVFIQRLLAPLGWGIETIDDYNEAVDEIENSYGEEAAKRFNRFCDKHFIDALRLSVDPDSYLDKTIERVQDEVNNSEDVLSDDDTVVPDDEETVTYGITVGAFVDRTYLVCLPGTRDDLALAFSDEEHGGTLYESNYPEAFAYVKEFMDRIGDGYNRVIIRTVEGREMSVIPTWVGTPGYHIQDL